MDLFKTLGGYFEPKKNTIEYTKELGGTLLVIMDGETFEIYRTNNSSYIGISPDNENFEITQEQRKILLNEWKKSNCHLI